MTITFDVLNTTTRVSCLA